MALCPFAAHRLIPAGSNDPAIVPVGAVLHVDAGDASSLYAYFNGPSGGIESHFHIRRDGVIEQYRDTSREADANYKGNSWPAGKGRHGLISIETQGYEHGEWTGKQLASIKRLLAWLADTHGFPLQVAPSWQGPGVGYHVMFGAPGPWTSVAKTCPGPDRIEQFNDEIVPWMRVGTRLEDDDMPYSDWPKRDRDALVEDVVDGVLGAQIARYNGKNTVRLDTILGWIYRDAHQLKRGLVSRILNARIRRHNGKPVRLETMLGWIYRDGREDPALIVDSPDGERQHSKPFVLGQLWELLLDRAPEPVRSRLVAANAAASAPADDVEDDQPDVPDEDDEDAEDESS